MSKRAALSIAAESLVILCGIACLTIAACDGEEEEASTCDNGVVDLGEACDPGIASGEGSCPSSCEEASDPCVVVALVGAADSCTATCETGPLRDCIDGDSCCASGCSANDDDDCEVECGNGVVEAGETCDGDCPSACDTGDPCRTGTFSGSADGCDAHCDYEDSADCADDDGCCPSSCNSSTDSDCVGAMGEPCTSDSGCSSGLCATGEGYGMPGGYCTAKCLGSPTACETGAHCGADRNGVAYCLRSCTSSEDCRTGEGYDCIDKDGDGRNECAALGSGTAAVGDACSLTTDCGGDERGFCSAPMYGSSGGYCMVTRCDDTLDGACPGGSHCAMPDRLGLGLCLRDCSGASDCRSDGYACYDGDGDGSDECWSAGTGSGAVGASCTHPADCAGGAHYFCISFWDDGYCAANCTPSIGVSCPAESHCTGLGEFSTCLDTCEGEADCRSGYRCTDIDSDGTNECFLD